MMTVVGCQDGDLNPGHEDFQSSALPTELSRLNFEALILYHKKLNSYDIATKMFTFNHPMNPIDFKLWENCLKHG